MPEGAVKDTITTRVLKFSFTCSGGAVKTYTLADPKQNLTDTEVRGVMDEMIEDEVVIYNQNEATDIKDAYIYETNKIDLQ